MWTRSVTAAALLVLVVSVSASGRTTSENKQAAQLDAQLLFSRLRLPAGAVQLAHEPPGGGRALHAPGPPILNTNIVDAGGWWRVPGSMSKVLAFLEGHPPHGGIVSSTGSTGQGHRITERMIVFFWPGVPGVLYRRGLDVELAPLAGGATGVRADAGVQWTVPRPPSERVPATARVLTVTRTTLPGWPPPLALTVTDPVKVRRIAAALDKLQMLQPEVISCPALFPSPTVAFTFYDRLGGSRLARATMSSDGPDGPCAPIIFSVRGQSEKPLLALPAFLRKAGRILGVTLH